MIFDIAPAAPEIFVLGMACVVLIVEAYHNEPSHALVYWLAQVTLLGAAVLTLYFGPEQTVLAFNDIFVSDPMSALLKVAVCVVTFVVFLYSRTYLREHDLLKGEYFVLGLFAVLGMMVLISAHNLLTIYLGLELLSLSLYAMVALHRDSESASEAAMKYFVLSALASGMLLYGISILYGVTGNLDLARVSLIITEQTEPNTLLIFGLVFVIVGVAFKLGAVPFHMWIPDVYQGAPTSVTLFISTAPKLAAFAMAIRLLVDGLGGLIGSWQDMLIILSFLSMAAGNIIAIAQSNIKRMLAYSTIAHVGFLLLGILSGTLAGYSSAMFYVIVYALMTTAAFGMVILLSRSGFESDRLDDFKGLAQQSQWFAFVMLIVMFSLAGVPPFVGFWGKWFVLKEVIDAGIVWLAAFAVIFTVIGAFYYLRIVKLMYFDKADTDRSITSSHEMRFVISVNGLAILALGLAPGLLMSLCVAALSA
ncbi:MAG: NADH-quinone oxidoreductase subunit NuoN [Gammaproteobacteria bacterium]|nr:NADH-quinone oxidoreductase subunit NuoN [Gammaproteobacteria bacterium]MCI0590446.1 NADH-quinone oxidoreductase subunit NuoN [Gammaproteobacteria bacterium]